MLAGTIPLECIIIANRPLVVQQIGEKKVLLMIQA